MRKIWRSYLRTNSSYAETSPAAHPFHEAYVGMLLVRLRYRLDGRHALWLRNSMAGWPRCFKCTSSRPPFQPSVRPDRRNRSLARSRPSIQPWREPPDSKAIRPYILSATCNVLHCGTLADIARHTKKGEQIMAGFSREQLDALRRQIEEDYRLDMAALERLQRRFSNSAPAPSLPVLGTCFRRQHH